MYKYIHFFMVNETIYSIRTIKMINDLTNGFNLDEHLFVTAHQELYDKIHEYPNTELVRVENPISADVINNYIDRGEWFILHSLPPVEEVFKINPKLWKKIIWRTWGHDTGIEYIKGEHYYNIKRYIKNKYFRFIVRHFKVVGIANLVDDVDISSRFGDVKMYPLGYLNPEKDEILEHIKNNFHKSDKTMNILLGHSGFPNDNHIKILESLKNYLSEDICIFLVMSYGDKNYISLVKEYVNKTFIDTKKIIIIEEFMPYKDYMEFLAKMDIAIFDGDRSYALGNIFALMYFEKKIYLNERGIIKKSFDMDNIPYHLTSSIGFVSYEDFVKPVFYKTSYSAACLELVAEWHKCLNYLNYGEDNK